MAWRCGDGRVGERALGSGQRHETALVRAMDELFGELGLEPSRLRHLCMGLGPGSFTGTRVALAVAHMATLAGGVRVMGVETDEVIAEGFAEGFAEESARQAGRIVIVLNSKKGGGYLSRWEPGPNGRFERVWAGMAECVEDWVAALVQAEPMPTVLLSQVDLAIQLPAGVKAVIGGPAFPRASCLLAIGTRRAESQSPRDLEQFPLPLYGRQPEATTLWEKRRVKGKE